MNDEQRRLPSLEALERELVARAEAEEAQEERGKRSSASWRIALGVGLMAVFFITPWGQALAERVADLIVGSEPTRERVNPTGEPAEIVGFGETPSGQEFEVVLSRDPAFGDDTGRGTCLSLDFGDLGHTEAAQCLTEDLERSLDRFGIQASATDVADPSLGDFFLVTGFAASQTRSVVVADDDARMPASLVSLPDGLPQFFYAWLPPSLSDRLTVEATRNGGKRLGEVAVPVIEVPP